jgi:glycine cleavage system H lipoate-binding protein
MKQVSGNLWFTTEKDETRIGFTRSFIAERLSECFHVLPADTKNVKEKGPLLVLETNDGLEPVCSPVTGRLTYFNEKARNFPDRLTEEDCIVSLSSKELKKIAPMPRIDDDFVIVNHNAPEFNFNQVNFNVPPAGAWAVGVQAQAAPPMPQEVARVHPPMPELVREPRAPVREQGEPIATWNARIHVWMRTRDEIRQINRDRVAPHARQMQIHLDAEHAQRIAAVPPQRVIRNPVRYVAPRNAWPDDLEAE